ncbi:DUF99 family protein [Natronosalvus halobius]|uniref:endonuclease dU n=1 Tax=Natronosalvus halobius TaxID=2953746 RepID=UPI0020A16CCF|nr:DUF99 family protein [Natronosalvus halobius]USZ73375.1 DUF99 family protein [Natronosalvus halobius]
MKPGTRALGIAESYRPGADESTLAGVVVRADRVLDGAIFDRCTVGGLDATDAIVSLVTGLERPDVRVCFVGAVAPAWYNLLDLEAIYDRTGVPVVAVTFEESDGLEPGLREAFSGEALEMRLERYRSLPPRRSVRLESEMTSDGADSDEMDSDEMDSDEMGSDEMGSDGADSDGAETVYVRTAGLDADRAASFVQTFTPEGGRPEPIRVARTLARAGDASFHDRVGHE